MTTTTAPPPATIRGIWMTHEALEASNPMDHEYAMQAEMRRKRDYAVSHGGLDGYVPLREFPCPGDLEWVDRSGPVWATACSVCGFEMGIPARTIDPTEETRRRIEIARFPLTFRDKPFEKTPESARARHMLREWVDSWDHDDRSSAPCLTGLPGRGKTHLLVLVATDLIRRHLVDVMFSPAGELIESMRSTTDTSQVERALRCGLLILDDLSKAPTDWTAERMYQLVDARYRTGKPVLITTNIMVQDWADTFGARTASRLAEMTAPVLVEGPDWRQESPADPSDSVTGRSHGNSEDADTFEDTP